MCVGISDNGPPLVRSRAEERAVIEGRDFCDATLTVRREIGSYPAREIRSRDMVSVSSLTIPIGCISPDLEPIPWVAVGTVSCRRSAWGWWWVLFAFGGLGGALSAARTPALHKVASATDVAFGLCGMFTSVNVHIRRVAPGRAPSPTLRLAYTFIYCA